MEGLALWSLNDELIFDFPETSAMYMSLLLPPSISESFPLGKSTMTKGFPYCFGLQILT